MDNSVIALWEDLKKHVSDIELFVVKNAGGNNSAGVKARKGLRDLKIKAAELVKVMVETDRSNRAANKAAKQQPTDTE